MGEVRSPAVRWLPFAVVVLAQIVVAANLTTLDVSIGAIVADFPTATTNVQSAIVICSLITAAMMILSGRAGAMFGSLPMFRGGVLLLGIGMAGVALSRGPVMLIVAEAVAGAATAALAPTLVALVSASYEGRERTLAIGALGVAGTAVALVLAGMLGTALGWRVPFWIMVVVAALVLVASRLLAPSPKQAGVTIDWLGSAAVCHWHLVVDDRDQWHRRLGAAVRQGRRAVRVVRDLAIAGAGCGRARSDLGVLQAPTAPRTQTPDAAALAGGRGCLGGAPGGRGAYGHRGGQRRQLVPTAALHAGRPRS